LFKYNYNIAFFYCQRLFENEKKDDAMFAKNGVPEKYCEANFLGEGETNEAILKGSARKPLSLAKLVWTRVSGIITAGNIICQRQTSFRPNRFIFQKT